MGCSSSKQTKKLKKFPQEFQKKVDNTMETVERSDQLFRSKIRSIRKSSVQKEIDQIVTPQKQIQKQQNTEKIPKKQCPFENRMETIQLKQKNQQETILYSNVLSSSIMRSRNNSVSN